MIGAVIALLAGTSFSVSNAFIRKGVWHSGESYTLIPIFAIMGTVALGIPSFATGSIAHLATTSWVSLVLLALAGIIHFILGRLFGFAGMRIIGATRAVPILAGSLFFSALIGIVFLHEPASLARILAILLIGSGVVIISSTSNMPEVHVPKGMLAKGYLLTFIGWLCWGTSPILIKLGLKEVTDPVLAGFVSYAAALIVIAITLLHPANMQRMRNLTRAAFVPLFWGAVAVSLAQLLRYVALTFTGVSVVEPCSGSMNSLFIFPLSLMMNRKLEAFTPRIILGAIAIVIGIILMFV